MGERVKLTESVIANLEGRLTAQGRDLSTSQDIWDAELRGLFLRREASGTKGWHLRVQVNGRRSKIKLGVWPTLSAAEARKAAKVEAAKVAKGGDPITDKRTMRKAEAARRAKAERASAAILGTFVDGEYKAWAEKNLRGNNRKETVLALKRNFGQWWNRQMDSITALDVERWRRERLNSGVTKATVNREWGRLRAAMGKAQEWGIITAPVRIRRLRLSDDESKRTRYLTAGERERLMCALDAREQRRRESRSRMILWQRERGQAEFPEHGAYTDHLKPLVLLVLNTGMRRSEALGLTWQTINFERGMIRVKASTSKTARTRDVPMTAQARDVLEALYEQNAAKDSSAYIFALSDGTPLKSIGKETWKALMAAADIRDFRFHDMRHDYASRLVMAGVDLYSVSKLLGHSDVSMTQRYAHLSPDYLKAAVSKLDGAERAA